MCESGKKIRQAIAVHRNCKNRRDQFHARFAAQAIWTVLLLVHLLPLHHALTALPAGDDLGKSIFRIIILTALATFFILKIAQVRWLRWPFHITGAIPFVLVIALVHDGVLPQSAQQAIASELPTTIAASILIGELARAAHHRTNLRDALRREFAFVLRLMPSSIAKVHIESTDPLEAMCPARIPRAPPRAAL